MSFLVLRLCSSNMENGKRRKEKKDLSYAKRKRLFIIIERMRDTNTEIILTNREITNGAFEGYAPSQVRQ